MSIQKSAGLLLLLIVSAITTLWGFETDVVAAAKWDLWENSNESAEQSVQKERTPSEQQASAPADTVREPSDKAARKASEDERMKVGAVAEQPEQRTTSPAADSPQPSGDVEKKTVGKEQPQGIAVAQASVAADYPGVRTVAVESKSNAGTPVAAPGNVPVGADPAYLIGPGDILEISVWKDEALSRSVVVLPDGKISFPLIGEIYVGGRTIGQVKEELTSKLTRYVPELVLSIEVKQSNSMQIYVIGRVNIPGKQILNSKVNVLQALAMAGGLNPFASRNKIKILRKDGEKTLTIPFRYGDVVDGDNIESNFELQRGDVIVVP
jgi:polysaccharide biosynthesis/export protein